MHLLSKLGSRGACQGHLQRELMFSPTAYT
jgi:hypothetical protein